ncbi:hypothetical protein QBC47DRAFT_152008 [Echria macrotheca]|uniref:Uncharacterized protein n=1 Tax=Echria macrotheca TaxID=438768 RepID=A0AAJ0F0V8_9PEZI|nr:hypothetical protein QBC47DRAFT_152008 [Echria macrotheca]
MAGLRPYRVYLCVITFAYSMLSTHADLIRLQRPRYGSTPRCRSSDICALSGDGLHRRAELRRSGKWSGLPTDWAE